MITRKRRKSPVDDPAWQAKRAEEVRRNREAFEAEHGCTVDQWMAEQAGRTRTARDLLFAKRTRPDPFTELLLSPFRELGIEANATPAEVRRAFRVLVLRRHPDRGGTQEAFVALEQAYRDAMAIAEGRQLGAKMVTH